MTSSARPHGAVLVLLAGFVAFAAGPPGVLAQKAGAKPAVAPRPAAGDVARVLAGRPCEALGDEPWRRQMLARHRARIDAHWASWERSVGTPLRDWAAATLVRKPRETVFYPFSGPDLATIFRLYPDAERYVFVAYQRAGRLPRVVGADRGDLHEILRLFERGLWSFAKRGYFITLEMNEHYYQSALVEGILGMLLVLAELEEFDVEAVEPIRVNPDTGALELHPGERTARSTWNSARLRLRRRESGLPLVLDYVRIDLLDRKLAKLPGQRRWLARVSHFPTLLKAASHLLQRPGFSFLREALLAHAPSVLQDESGLPYEALAARFELRLFGRFGGFHERFPQFSAAERQLRRAFRAGASTPLPFHLGYKKRTTSCLIYAGARSAGPTPAGTIDAAP